MGPPAPALRPRLAQLASIDERILRATLGTVVEVAAAGAPMERTALILVGHVLGAREFRGSALYDAEYHRRFRGGAGARHDG